MNLRLKYGLPFVTATLTHKGKALTSNDFLIELVQPPPSSLLSSPLI
nr:hypothetical protein [Desulforamulus aquiferis]